MTDRKNRQPGAFRKTEKVMQTFRMSRDLVSFLRGEADRRGLDLTAYVTRVLDGLRTYQGLPGPAARLLDQDRRALTGDYLDYLHHLLYLRSVEVRQKGPGFDDPRPKRSWMQETPGTTAPRHSGTRGTLPGTSR